MLTKSTTLLYYKQPQIQKAIVGSTKDREIAARFGDAFGKRPDVLTYPQDVLELAKQGATSFHVSEEIWKNPLQIDTKLKKQELESLRTGWDLVIDIDCPEWEFSKKIAHAIVQVLLEHGIRCVSCKFSGNKGFHIGVPNKAFPKTVHGTPIKLLFPEGARRIALYLKDKIEHRILEEVKKTDLEKKYVIRKIVCKKCGKENRLEKKAQFVCRICGATEEVGKVGYKKCQKCKIFMEKLEGGTPKCRFCAHAAFKEIIDISSLMEIDTVLISSRHLYRALYSLHEKSGLASIPIALDRILTFEKEMAKPENIKEIGTFLDESNVKEGEAAALFLAAFDYKPKTEEAALAIEVKQFEIPEEAIPQELFPPCMKLGLMGLKDGKKRFLFAVTNFLRGAGWSYEQMEVLLKEWNQKNEQPMREGDIENHLRYHKQKQNIPPPNCDNQPYYVQVGICKPDAFCSRIRNPLQYSRFKVQNALQDRPKMRKKKEDGKITSSPQMQDMQN